MIKRRYTIESDDGGALVRDVENDQPMIAFNIGSKSIPNQTTARCRCIEKLAMVALSGAWTMTDAERFYWLTHATELAADNAMAEAMDDCPDDVMPEDHEPAAFIDGPRHSIYEAQWALDAEAGR